MRRQTASGQIQQQRQGQGWIQRNSGLYNYRQRSSCPCTGIQKRRAATGSVYPVREIAGDHLFQAFGKSISAVGIVCGLGQTIIAIHDGEELSTGDWMNIVSTTIGIASVFIPASFPIVAGTIGVASGVIGIVSSLFSYNIPSGLYIIETINGSTIYLYIGNTVTA